MSPLVALVLFLSVAGSGAWAADVTTERAVPNPPQMQQIPVRPSAARDRFTPGVGAPASGAAGAVGGGAAAGGAAQGVGGTDTGGGGAPAGGAKGAAAGRTCGRWSGWGCWGTSLH